jgi:hypothetical protein
MMLVGFIIGVITCVMFTIMPGRHKTEYVNNYDGVVYKYVGDVRTLAGKQYHVLLSTKDNGYIALTESELKSKFHPNVC